MLLLNLDNWFAVERFEAAVSRSTIPSPPLKEPFAVAVVTDPAQLPAERDCREAFGKGQMGSALMGSLQISCFLTEGPFGYSR